MKNLVRIISDISLVVGIGAFIIFIVKLINNKKFNFGTIEIVGLVAFIIFFIVFSRDKRGAMVDIWNILDFLTDFFS